MLFIFYLVNFLFIEVIKITTFPINMQLLFVNLFSQHEKYNIPFIIQMFVLIYNIQQSLGFCLRASEVLFQHISEAYLFYVAIYN